MTDTATPTDATIWFRLLLPAGALGPGKIALMQAIDANGSVSAAARSLRMSHARSVKLVAEINGLAAMPLVDTRTGGAAGGGASLTALGQDVLAAHARIAQAVRQAAAPTLEQLQRILSAPAGDADG